MSKKKTPPTHEKKETVSESASEETLEETSDACSKTTPTQDHESETEDTNHAALEAEIASLKDRLLRNQAELQNFKRRMTEERIRDRVLANVELIRALLTPLDDFDRGLIGEASNEKVKPHLKGFEMIRNSIFEVLKTQGLEEVEADGRPFDPKVHQAVATEKHLDYEPGHVMEVYQKGYLYKERLIRPAMVKVSE